MMFLPTVMSLLLLNFPQPNVKKYFFFLVFFITVLTTDDRIDCMDYET